MARLSKVRHEYVAHSCFFVVLFRSSACRGIVSPKAFGPAQHSCSMLELGSTSSMSLRRGTIFCVHAHRVSFYFFVEPE